MPKSDDVPPPPRLEELIRTSRGLPKTLTEQMYDQLDARLRVNGGRLVPLTADELAQAVPPPPDLNAKVKLAALKRRVDEEKKRNPR